MRLRRPSGVQRQRSPLRARERPPASRAPAYSSRAPHPATMSPHRLRLRLRGRDRRAHAGGPPRLAQGRCVLSPHPQRDGADLETREVLHTPDPRRGRRSDHSRAAGRRSGGSLLDGYAGCPKGPLPRLLLGPRRLPSGPMGRPPRRAPPPGRTSCERHVGPIPGETRSTQLCAPLLLHRLLSARSQRGHLSLSGSTRRTKRFPRLRSRWLVTPRRAARRSMAPPCSAHGSAPGPPPTGSNKAASFAHSAVTRLRHSTVSTTSCLAAPYGQQSLMQQGSCRPRHIVGALASSPRTRSAGRGAASPLSLLRCSCSR